jgi:hypothetical protein
MISKALSMEFYSVGKNTCDWSNLAVFWIRNNFFFFIYFFFFLSRSGSDASGNKIFTLFKKKILNGLEINTNFKLLIYFCSITGSF